MGSKNTYQLVENNIR